PGARHRRGVVYRSRSKFDAAIADLSEAIRLSPESAVVRLDRGIARSSKGDYAGAIDDYSEAIRLDPGLAPAWWNRAVVRERKGDRDGAIADLRKVIELTKPGTRFQSDARERVRTLETPAVTD
ncbi:MAG: tetratricopeptide repeat protein, partial [Candidatus Binatia bacterium]